MNDVAVIVCQHLVFDMTGLFQITLHVNGIIVERGLGLATGELPGIQQRSLGMDHTHTFATTTSGCLDDNGVTDVSGGAYHLIGVVPKRPI